MSIEDVNFLIGVLINALSRCDNVEDSKRIINILFDQLILLNKLYMEKK